MATKTTASEMLDREFLKIRHRLLDVAAALDRIDRCDGGAAIPNDARLAQVRSALGAILGGQLDRAEHVQMVFSDEYDESWRPR